MESANFRARGMTENSRAGGWEKNKRVFFSAHKAELLMRFRCFRSDPRPQYCLYRPDTSNGFRRGIRVPRDAENFDIYKYPAFFQPWSAGGIRFITSVTINLRVELSTTLSKGTCDTRWQEWDIVDWNRRFLAEFGIRIDEVHFNTKKSIFAV